MSGERRFGARLARGRAAAVFLGAVLLCASASTARAEDPAWTSLPTEGEPKAETPRPLPPPPPPPKPPPRPAHRSVAMMSAGATLITLAVYASVIGAVLLHNSAHDEGPSEAFGGMLTLIGAGVDLAVGIPLLVVGMRPPPVVEPPRSSRAWQSPSFGPGSAALRWSF